MRPKIKPITTTTLGSAGDISISDIDLPSHNRMTTGDSQPSYKK